MRSTSWALNFQYFLILCSHGVLFLNYCTCEFVADTYLPPVNPPANLPENPPANLPVNPPENPPANLPVNPPANLPENPPTNLPENPPTNLPENPPANLPENPPANLPENPPANLPENPPANLPENPPANPPVNLPANLVENPPINLPAGGYLPPTCPNFTLFHIPTRKCYDSGFQGPCGNKMIFLNAFPSNEDSHVGECMCENSGKGDNFWTRPLVLWSDTQQCYFIYDQGPCPEGQWLVGNGGVRCEQIPCPTQYLVQRYSQSGRTPEDKQFLFSYEGQCYFTLTQGFCSNGTLAVFTNGSFEPKCQSQEEGSFQTQGAFGGSPANSCAEGKASFNNNCESESNI